MRRFHIVFGVIVFVVFLLTGQYMDFYYNHLIGMDAGLRMLIRSRHIYILFAALVNLGIGSYFSYRSQQWRRNLQYFGSALIMVATLSLIAAFFYEPKMEMFVSPIAPWGIYLIVAGTFFHFLSGLRRRFSQ